MVAHRLIAADFRCSPPTRKQNPRSPAPAPLHPVSPAKHKESVAPQTPAVSECILAVEPCHCVAHQKHTLIGRLPAGACRPEAGTGCQVAAGTPAAAAWGKTATSLTIFTGRMVRGFKHPVAAGGARHESTRLATHQAVGGAAVVVVEGAVVLAGGRPRPLERALLPAPRRISAHNQQPALDGTAEAHELLAGMKPAGDACLQTDPCKSRRLATVQLPSCTYGLWQTARLPGNVCRGLPATKADTDADPSALSTPRQSWSSSSIA